MRIDVSSDCVGPSLAIIPVVLVLLVLAFPGHCEAGDPFPGYAPEVSAQAQRVVQAAGPGLEKELAGEVRRLRKRMYAHGILSINAIPDLVFRRATQEGWKDSLAPSFRIVTEVSPLSGQMWAWLVKEDILRLRLVDLFPDLEGFSGALWGFGPALLGYAAWLISYASAAACWFVVLISISLFLRARPSLELDIGRVVRLPKREFLSPLAAAAIFLFPLVAGMGLVLVVCVAFATLAFASGAYKSRSRPSRSRLARTDLY